MSISVLADHDHGRWVPLALMRLFVVGVSSLAAINVVSRERVQKNRFDVVVVIAVVRCWHCLCCAGRRAVGMRDDGQQQLT